MSTNSYIAKKIADDKYEVIYCHWDGYIEEPGVGFTLYHHWQSEEKVDSLMELGNLSILGKETGRKQDFNKPTKGWCLAYARDREDMIARPWLTTKEKLFSSVDGREFLYIWDGGQWFVCTPLSHEIWGQPVLLEMYMVEEDNQKEKEMVEILERNKKMLTALLKDITQDFTVSKNLVRTIRSSFSDVIHFQFQLSLINNLLSSDNVLQSVKREYQKIEQDLLTGLHNNYHNQSLENAVVEREEAYIKSYMLRSGWFRKLYEIAKGE